MQLRRINDEGRDRAVRRVLWTSLAIGLFPIIAAVALQPRLSQLSFSHAVEYLNAEVTFGRNAPGDQVRSILKRASADFVRATGAGDEFLPDGEAPGFLSRIEQAVFSGPRTCLGLRGGTVGGCPTPQTAEAAAGAGEEIPLLLELPALRASAVVLERRDAGRGSEPGWRLAGEGVYVHELGPTSFTVAGAVAVDDLASLRPIDEIGVGAYLSDAPELHHSALSGRAAGTFEQGVWRLRPELDVEASYLALEKVRVDAGEAGLFLPEADDWIFSARPSLALEGELEAAPGILLTPRVRAGATWLSQNEFSLAATMLDAPVAVGGVAPLSPIAENTFADVEAGLGIAASDRLLFQLSYGRLYGETFETQTGRVELSMQF